VTALLIAANDIRRLFRERAALFWIFVGPVIFVTFFGIVFKPRQARPPTLALVNEDTDEYLVRAMQMLLERDGVAIRRSDHVEPGAVTLVVPKGAGESFGTSKPIKPVFHAGREETNTERSLRFKATKALMAVYLATAPVPSAATRDPEALVQRLAGGEVLKVRAEDLGVRRREVTAGFQRSVASYLVMFVLLNLLALGAGLAEERASGRMRRLFIAPVSRAQIVLGKLLMRFTVGWIQVAYMLAVGVLIFKIQWADHSWVFFAFLSVYALAAAALGMLIGTLFDDPDKASTAGIWTAILLSPLGGLWWPLEVVGPTMRTVGHLVPTGWAMEGVNSMLAFGAGAREVAPFAAALLALFAASFTMAVRRLRP
jgi:ABC-2 type transport system permease protein